MGFLRLDILMIAFSQTLRPIHGCFQLHVQIETAVVINFSRLCLASGWTLSEYRQRGQDFWWRGYLAFL